MNSKKFMASCNQFMNANKFQNNKRMKKSKRMKLILALIVLINSHR